MCLWRDLCEEVFVIGKGTVLVVSRNFYVFLRFFSISGIIVTYTEWLEGTLISRLCVGESLYKEKV